MKNETTSRTARLFDRCAQEFNTTEELADYAMTMAALGVALLRGIEGHKFARGFLMGALDEKSPMVIKPEKVKVN